MAVAVRKMTYQEFRQLEFDDNDPFLYELIKGELVKKSAPSPEHQEISGLLYNKIFTHVSEKKLGKILYAPIDVFLDEHSVPQPDLVFVRQEQLHIIDKKEGIIGRPDLVIEIVSPNSVKRDRFDKKDLYEQFAIPEYWIVDPQNATIEVYRLQNNHYVLSSFAAQSGAVHSEALGGWKLEVSQLFEV